MLKVLILEDNNLQRKTISQIVQNRIMINNTDKSYDMEIAISTDNPVDAINYVENHREEMVLAFLDIDLKNKRLNISRTLTTDEKGNIIMGNTTKTYSGKRTIPIPYFLYPYIVEQMKIANKQINNDEKLLFKPDNSKYCRRSTINNELKRILKQELNITDISSHSLRHTFGTRCIESGMAPVVVQRLMGHKDITVTLNTYTSVLEQFKERELDKVNRYYLNENLIGTNLISEKNDNEKEI